MMFSRYHCVNEICMIWQLECRLSYLQLPPKCWSINHLQWLQALAIKTAVASTCCLWCTLSSENGVNLASVPLVVSCVDIAITVEALLDLG